MPTWSTASAASGWCTTASCRKTLRQVYGAAREQRRWGHEAPLALYDFRAEHWKHVRIANPIEGTFATVRLRTTKIKDCLSRQAALAMVFQLCQSAQWRWRRLDGPGRLAEVVHGVRFVDGERRIQDAA